MKWVKYNIIVHWWDLLPNDFEIELIYSEYEAIKKVAEKSNKLAITEDMPYIEVLSIEK